MREAQPPISAASVLRTCELLGLSRRRLGEELCPRSEARSVDTEAV